MEEPVHRVPHSSHWGAYTLLVQGDRIIGTEPFEFDPDPSPIIHSVAGWADPSRRVLRPMVREGWLEQRENSNRRGRGRERFIPVSWDEVNSLIVEELRRVTQEHGNRSIFAGSYGWTSCGRFHHAATLLKRLLNLTGGYTGHVDTYSIAAGPVILRHVLGDARACSGQGTTLENIADHTENLVVFGALSPRTEQIEAGGIARHTLTGKLRRMAERGVRIVLVSPSRDDLPEWVPCEWWPVRPNTDTALLLGLAGEILDQGKHDQDFLDRYTSGAEDYLDYLSGTRDSTPKTPEWAASITGLDGAAIRALAGHLTQSRSMLTLSWSLQRAHHGEQPYWAALGLASLIGQIGLPGGGVGYGNASLGGVGAALNLARSPAMSQGQMPLDSFIPVARITDMLLNPGGEYTYEGRTLTYPDTRLVWWAGGNPFHHHQDLNRLGRAWERPETIIVQDPMFTATAQRADILLPASTSIERNDIAGNKRSDHLIAMHRAIRPLGEARSDFDIFNELAARLGVAEAFNEGRDEMGWIRHLYEQSRTDAAERLAFEMPPFETFWEQGYARCPVEADHVYLADYRADPQAHALNTETGKIVLGSKTLARLDLDDCPSHPAWLEPAEWLGQNADDTRQKFHLISRQPVGKLHSQLDHVGSSLGDKRDGREQITLNTADARQLGISDGMLVRVWNARGTSLAVAHLSDDIRSGVVCLPTGSWFTQENQGGLELAGNPNVLTLDIGTSQFGQGCSAHTCLVQVGPYEDEADDPLLRQAEHIRFLRDEAS